MKIGIDARMLGREQATGIGNYLFQIISRYKNLDHQNEFVIFLCPENKDVLGELPRNFKVILTDIRWYTWQEQLLYPFVLWKEKVDLMHFPNYNVPLIYRGAFLVTIHDLIPLDFPGHKANSPLKRKLQKMIIAGGIKNSKKIITVSNHSKAKIIEKFKVNEDKIFVTYEGVEKDFGKLPESDKITARLASFKITQPYIFYVGVQRNHKNILGLIQAFALIRKSRQIQLVIGGTKNVHFPEMEVLIDSLDEDVKKDIIRTGFLSNEDLGIIYSAAQVYVVPSFEEGFGLNALDAMSYQIPVASSNTSCLPEIYGQAAHYFNPYDVEDMAQKITKVIDDHDLREELIVKGLERIKLYSWDNTAKQTLEIYAAPCPLPKEKSLKKQN